jgi:hypothetical protein
MQGKDFSHPLEMTMPVMSNPSAMLQDKLRERSFSTPFFKGVHEAHEDLRMLFKELLPSCSSRLRGESYYSQKIVAKSQLC